MFNRSFYHRSLMKNKISIRLLHRRSVLRVVRMPAYRVVTEHRTCSSRLYRISYTSRFIRTVVTVPGKDPTRVHRIKRKRSLDTVRVIGPATTKTAKEAFAPSLYKGKKRSNVTSYYRKKKNRSPAIVRLGGAMYGL